MVDLKILNREEGPIADWASIALGGEMRCDIDTSKPIPPNGVTNFAVGLQAVAFTSLGRAEFVFRDPFPTPGALFLAPAISGHNGHSPAFRHQSLNFEI